jgi:hypothetical protein
LCRIEEDEIKKIADQRRREKMEVESSVSSCGV